jgi:hypothetical protein
VSEILVDGVDAANSRHGCAPPLRSQLQLGYEGFTAGFDTDYPEVGSGCCLRDVIARFPRFDARSEPWAWALVAFSAKGLPAESPSPRDSGQTPQDPVVLQPQGRSTMPMHVFWTWESSGLKRDSAPILN